MLAYLIKGLGLGIYAGLLPGPTQAFILSKTVRNGWQRSLLLALVPLVSDLPIALLFCLFVSTFSPKIITYIQIVGGAYLIYLGIQTWISTRKDIVEDVKEEEPRGFWQTVGINLGNPNVYVFWGTIGAPIVVSGWGNSPAWGMAFVVGMYSMLILVTAATILLFGLTGSFSGAVRRWILLALAVVVIGFGIYQGFTGILVLLNH